MGPRISVLLRRTVMHNKLKFYARELFLEWLSKFLTFQTFVTAMIIFKIAKYFYFGSEHAAKIWSMNKISSYQVLSFVWKGEVFRLVLVLPLAMLLDIFLKDIVKRKPNPGANWRVGGIRTNESSTNWISGVFLMNRPADAHWPLSLYDWKWSMCCGPQKRPKG